MILFNPQDTVQTYSPKPQQQNLISQSAAAHLNFPQIDELHFQHAQQSANPHHFSHHYLPEKNANNNFVQITSSAEGTNEFVDWEDEDLQELFDDKKQKVGADEKGKNRSRKGIFLTKTIKFLIYNILNF